MDKEVLEFWKEVNPESAFCMGVKECVAILFIPSYYNVKKALAKIEQLQRGADPAIQKFLNAEKRGLMREEPQDAPDQIMGVFYTHLVKEGVNEKHVLALAEQSLNVLGVQQHLWEESWPVELQIFSSQSCDGAVMLLEIIKKECKGEEVKEALVAVQNRLKLWKVHTCKVKLTGSDFAKTFPLLQKYSNGLGRKKEYAGIIKDLYAYMETPDEIEHKALLWIDEELPALNNILTRLAKRYKCKPTVEDINKALEKHQHVPLKELVKTTMELRSVLQVIAHDEWVQITPKYDVRVIETPKYLVPFLPTAAMQPFDGLTKKPFCLSFVTTDPKASPSTFLPALVQTLVHEEYGHCVNFMDSFTNPQNRVVEIMGSTLDTPITEGISFFREVESTRTFERVLKKGPKSKSEKEIVKLIEKFCPFDAFVDGILFEVAQWRMVRFLRAVSDVRLNLEKQNFPEFIDWAHEKTGLSKKLVFDQTFHFQQNPGYAPCYSVFGQRLRDFQKQAMKNGFSQVEFNTFVASAGFPARDIFEERLKNKFDLA
ncbi:hypothetical protein J4211_00570 [Candidatus Woesearchaeota archaeon]|nr:hypothetical protein [Candidatus Woesearchaeota archaeon]